MVCVVIVGSTQYKDINIILFTPHDIFFFYPNRSVCVNIMPQRLLPPNVFGVYPDSEVSTS